jgi:protein AFG1
VLGENCNYSRVLIGKNRVPDDLYYHGVQSFLDALKSRCDVIELDGGRDWRRGLDPENPTTRDPSWYPTTDGRFEQIWSDAGGESSKPRTLSVYSRPLVIPQAIDRVCRFTFAELCEAPLGPADYLSLASTFDTFFIDEVPVLLLKAKNEARRVSSGKSRR